MNLVTKHDLCILLVVILMMSAVPSSPAQGASSAATAQIEGIVRDSAGKPLAEVSVGLKGENHPSSFDTQTKVDGSFLFSAVPAGTYSVQAKKAGFREASEDSIKLLPAEKKHCEFVLEAGASSSTPYSVASSSIYGIELDDRPNFTVAGITDSTGSGGHGSETRLRTGEVLARETLNLESAKSMEAAAESPKDGAIGPEIAREHVRQRLANENGLSQHDEADLRRMLGDLDGKLGDPLGAEREYERAAGLDASERNYFAWGAELLLHRAAAPAVEVFGRGARLHPDSARMLAGLGAALYTSGSADEAAQRLCEASDLDPANSTPYLFLGKMQEASPGPLPCAEHKLARFAQDQPENALANYYYAVALWKRNRASENADALLHAESLLQKAATIDPKLDAVYLQLGNLYVARGAFPQAVAAYQKAIAVNPGGSDAHYRLGLAYKRIGEDGKWQSEIEQYKQLESSEAAAIERQRRELGQFLFVLKNQPADHPSSGPAAPPVPK